MMIFWLIILAILIFYIFSKKGSGKSSASENDEVVYLKVAVHELSIIAEKSPDKSLKELIEDYEKRLKKLGSKEEIRSTDLNIQHSESVFNTNLENIWSRWYSNNSINLLLYMGAFLIIASASIFVGFQWETLSGVIKASFLTLVAIAFFGFGIWFFNIPKIRNAGNTFIAIAALLIPVCGSAWYNFVFKDLGVSPGSVWFITSTVALGVYLFLTYQYKNKFYTYISSLTSLSLVFSLVNTFNLNSDFYILAGIFTSFVLLLSSFALRGQEKDVQEYAQVPLELSAQVMMPAILGYGLFIAGGYQKLDTIQAVFSIFLSSGFYVLSYLHSKKSWNIAVSEILFSIGIALFFHWQKLDNDLLLYTLDICAFTYIYIAYFMKNLKLFEEQDISITIGLIQLMLTFVFSFILGIEPAHITLLSLALVLSGIALAYIKKTAVFMGISTVFAAETIYLFYAEVLKLHNLQNLGIIYFVIGLLSYVGVLYLSKKRTITGAFGLSSGFFFALSLIFALNSTPYLLVLGLLISGVAAHMAWQFKQPEMIYVSNFLITFSMLNFLRYYHINGNFYPFFYAGLAYVYYAMSLINKKFQDMYRSSALVMSIITPIFFGSESSFFGRGILERNSIMTAYSATILFGFDVYRRKVPNFGYITSVLGMISYLWQIEYSGVTENLAYTIPLGIYFLVLAYTRKINEDRDGRQVLDLLGLFFLLMPPFFLSFGIEVMKYSVILGLIGIALLGLGITLSHKLYRWGGVVGIVFAVLPQTYNYILLLPRWVAVGMVGLLFIGTAIYLSMKRKTDE